jgi:hypothetical protein
MVRDWQWAGARLCYAASRVTKTQRSSLRMPRSPAAWPPLLAAILALAACDDAEDGPPDRKPGPGGEVTEDPEAVAGALFSGEVTRIELRLPESAMAELAREPRDYVRGDATIAGHALPDVGLRFKGHRSMRPWSSKPAFKLDFDKYVKKRRFAGTTSLMLNNMVDDASLVREQLGYRVFRELGAPAPRAGYAEVFVNGQRFGLYALLEPVDGPLIADFFETPDDALIYEGEYGCDLYPDDVPGMELDEGDDPGREKLSALVRGADGPIMALLEGPDALLHAPHFFAFLAASVWVGDFDGYRHAHNYFLYFDPGRGRWSLIPWGLDRIFRKPIAPADFHARLARACFDDARCRLRFVKTLRAGNERLARQELPAVLDRVAAQIEPAARRDGRKPHGSKTRRETLARVREYLQRQPGRMREATACWDGERELDRDGDGFGCLDCDDGDPRVHPGATERCDGTDADCSGQADDAPTCDCAPVELKAARFELCDLEMDWLAARDFCAARGGMLATLDDDAQARALSDAAEEVREEHWWIGVHDRTREGRQEDLRGERPATRWASGEPDDYACGQDCAALKEDAHGRMRDLHCATPLPFICRFSQP